MTAVLSATDALRRDRIMSSHDDNQINYSSSNSTDWKEKYYEASDMLSETRAELDEFQRSSKELEEELERELERTERAQQDLRVKASRAETERDEWKSKFMHLQTTHNTTTASLQRELDILRQSHQQLKIQLRELELGNDDLERNERAVTSSLADVEAKYSRALEEKILIEHELMDKANLEEEFQRLKDELRDANTEISVLKDQLSQKPSRSSTLDSSSSTSAMSSLKPAIPSTDENIMAISPPSELSLSELTSKLSLPRQVSASSSSSSSEFETMKNSRTSSEAAAGQSVLLRRAGFPAAWMNASPAPSDKTASLARSHTVSGWSPSRLPTSSPISRPSAAQRIASESLTASTATAAASKSRGVQMVSEMRARVRNLEQKIHTRVPRLRLASSSSRHAANAAASSVSSMLGMSTSTPENPRVSMKRRSADLENEKKRTPTNPDAEKSADTSGWVLIMEDSMTPTPTRGKDRRRLSSPSSSPFGASMHRSSNSGPTNLGQSTLRRPQSRQSGETDGRASTSTVSTTSSIPTPTSRPSTPTFLPVPSGGMYASGLPMKRSTGPGPAPKRSSLGSANSSPTSFLQPPDRFRERPTSMGSLAASTNKSLPPPPPLSPNVTLRAPRPPSALGQSRIGRPTSLGGGRKSAGSEGDGSRLDTQSTKEGRSRAGSSSSANSRVV